MERERQIGGRQRDRQGDRWQIKVDERGDMRERESQTEKGLPSQLVTQFLEGRLQVKFIFDVPKKSNFPYILKTFDNIY